MTDSSADLLQDVAKAHGIDLQNTTDTGKFSAYVLTIRHIAIILSNDLEDFPYESLVLIKDALKQIRNGCNYLFEYGCDNNIYEYIENIRESLASALANINSAAHIYGQIMRNKRFQGKLYIEYQEALISCGDTTVDINTLLAGWKIRE